MSSTPINPFAFPKSHHLRTQHDFRAVYEARVVKRLGPLRIHSLPNTLNHPRLGLSVSRRVGKAHQRNRIKRLLREAFRLEQHNLAGSLDLVVVVTPHETRSLDDYRNLLLDAARSPWNPRWFNYGSLPLYTLKGIQLVGSALPGDELRDLRLPGRAMSALADVVAVALVFLIGR